MEIVVSETERAALEVAVAGARRVRDWRRYQAVVLVAQGQKPPQVARALGTSLASVYNWIAAWQRAQVAGLVEKWHAGRKRRFDAPGEQWLDALLSSDPAQHGYQATGWTVPLLRRAADQMGYTVSEQTMRRTIHRLGWRWKRPKYVLGRPDPAYTEKKRP